MTNDNTPSSDSPQDWRPPSGFIAVPSAVPGVEVFAPAPAADEPDRRTFKCPRCGASTAYNATDAALSCTHCGHATAPDAVVVGRLAAEAEFKLETLEQADRGWGQVRREIHCESCGADISLTSTELATTCPFCVSNRVIARDETRTGMLRPGHLIPFQVGRETGSRLLGDWLARGWMHPPALRKVTTSVRLIGVYLPFWTFAARLDTSWQAEVGRKRTRTTLSGKRKTEIKWERKSGRLKVYVEDMLMPGSSRISSTLLNRVYPFDLTALTAYDPAYLAGWRAQAYDVSLNPAWDCARSWMRDRAKDAVAADINSNYVRNLGVIADFENERWRYVLLPVYLVAYRVRGRAYQVLVNGQTGRIAGQKPVAWSRVGAVLAALLLPGLLLMLVAGFLPPDARPTSMMIGLIALVLGVAVASRLVRKALAADDA